MLSHICTRNEQRKSEKIFLAPSINYVTSKDGISAKLYANTPTNEFAVFTGSDGFCGGCRFSTFPSGSGVGARVSQINLEFPYKLLKSNKKTPDKTQGFLFIPKS